MGNKKDLLISFFDSTFCVSKTQKSSPVSIYLGFRNTLLLITFSFLGCLLSDPAFAIPSPDIAVSFFSNMAQLIGLTTVTVGGLFVSRKLHLRQSGEVSCPRSGRFLKWSLRAAIALLLASAALNVLQWADRLDERERRLQANLFRSSTEGGNAVGDVSLKTLPYSEQITHPLGITTDELARLMETARIQDGTEINFIDLREPEEREMGTVSGFIHVPYPDLRYGDPRPVVRALGLDRRKNILLCYSGNRSSEICGALAAKGIPCNFVKGGYEKWLAEGRSDRVSGDRTPDVVRSLPKYPNDDVLLDTPEVRRLVRKEGAQFVDVRYPDEFQLGHLPGAINLPIRKLRSPEMTAGLKSLPEKPVIAACYDKRSCFYSRILGLRLHRLGRDFRGRYTVPHDYFVAPQAETQVALWLAAGNRVLEQRLRAPLESLLIWAKDQTGSLALAIFIVVAALRLAMMPFTIKAERDQVVQLRLAPRIGELKERITGDPQRLSRAIRALNRKHHLTPGLNLLGLGIQIVLFLAFFTVVSKVAGQSSEGFLWAAALSRPDPLFLLPVAVGALVAIHLHGVAVKRAPLYLGMRVLVGWMFTAITLHLGSGLNLYLVFSLGMMILQSRFLRLLLRPRATRTRAEPPLPGCDVVPIELAHRVPGAGNKARRLGRLIKAGLPVPKGFVIPSVRLSTKGKVLNFPLHHRQRIESYWCKLRLERAAVRSSGLNEDGADQSYAGVFNSVLNVSRANLFEALREVQTSLVSPGAKTYGRGHAETGGILVQDMVDPEYAGVLFTEHPMKSGSMIVEMVSGLGDAVTDGATVPQTYSFGRWTRKPMDDAEAPVDLSPLLELGARAERLLGHPQDIEWAWRNGRFYLLQSRDITTLSRTRKADTTPRTLFERERHRLLQLTSMSAADEVALAQNELSELLPRPTPLSLSMMEALWRPGGSMDLACRTLGIPYDIEEDGPPLLTSVFGALYVDVREERRRSQRAPSALSSFRLQRAAEGLEHEFRDRFLPRFLQQVRLLEAIDFSRMKTEELFDLLTETCRRFTTETHLHADLINVAAGFYLKAAERKLKRYKLPPSLYLADLPETVVHQALSLLPGIRANSEELGTFLELFGHRSLVDYELAQPRYAEDPETVKKLAANAAESPGTFRAERREAEKPGNRALALTVERARRFQALKEEAKHHCLRELAVIRRMFVELDRHLELDGGIFYLDLDELMSLRQARLPRDLALRISERKTAADFFAKLTPPPSRLTPRHLESLASDGTTSVGHPTSNNLQGTLVAGEAAVVGRARVANGRENQTIQEGEILVTRYMHPGWTPMFSRAAGIVTEVGGWLSHTSILAREYNVTTIVGVCGAAERISTGDVLRLNLDGTVEFAQSEDGLFRNERKSGKPSVSALSGSVMRGAPVTVE